MIIWPERDTLNLMPFNLILFCLVWFLTLLATWEDAQSICSLEARGEVIILSSCFFAVIFTVFFSLTLTCSNYFFWKWVQLLMNVEKHVIKMTFRTFSMMKQQSFSASWELKELILTAMKVKPQHRWLKQLSEDFSAFCSFTGRLWLVLVPVSDHWSVLFFSTTHDVHYNHKFWWLCTPLHWHKRWSSWK